MIMYTMADDPMGDTEIAQVIAFICGMFVILLMIMGLISSDWLLSDGWRQGLFAHCIEEGAPSPLPFGITDPPGCYPARDVGYIKTAAILCVVCLVADIVATVLTGLGLRSKDHSDKNRYYRLAVISMGAALVVLLVALVIYPAFFIAEFKFGNRVMWEFGWAYGVGWGAAIFLFGGSVLLLCDKESEEVYYKERKIVRDDVVSGNSNNHHHHGNSNNSASLMNNSSVNNHYNHHTMRSGTHLA